LQEAKAKLRALKDRFEEDFRTNAGEAELSADEIVWNLWTEGRTQLMESFIVVERTVEVTG
jgi:hypothetical protein